MRKRDSFLVWVVQQLGRPVLWGAKGDYVVRREKVLLLPEPAYDCSGLVTCGLKAVGFRDVRGTHNAQRLWQCLPSTKMQRPGDLGFYGRDINSVSHVVVGLDGGAIISADGATPKVLELELAKADKTARVRRHDSFNYRRDTRWLGWKRNVWLDVDETLLVKGLVDD